MSYIVRNALPASGFDEKTEFTE